MHSDMKHHEPWKRITTRNFQAVDAIYTIDKVEKTSSNDESLIRQKIRHGLRKQRDNVRPNTAKVCIEKGA